MHELVSGHCEAQLSELLSLLVGEVLRHGRLEVEDDVHEALVARIEALELPEHPFELRMLGTIVGHMLVAIDEVVQHSGVERHLLDHRVTHQVGDQPVGDIAAGLLVSQTQAIEQVLHLPVLLDEHIQDIVRPTSGCSHPSLQADVEPLLRLVVICPTAADPYRSRRP